MTTTADLLIYGTGIELRVPYSKSFAEAIKAEIPAIDRDYDPDRKMWTVAREYQFDVERLCSNYFDDILIRFAYDEPQAKSERLRAKQVHIPVQPKPVQSTKDENYAILYLDESAPGCVIDAAYRALAKVHHPDMGGNAVDFKKLNTAYEAIKK